MVEFTQQVLKDLGTEKPVMAALPYAVVGDAWKGTFQNPHDTFIALNHIIPAGQQLKLLFLRVWTQESGGAVFTIEQTNPFEAGHTGTVEAFPVVGNVPPFKPDENGPATYAVRDYPMLEAAGAEILHGSLEDPIHVFEGSIAFGIQHTPTPATNAYYGIVWWGVQKPHPPA